MFRNPYSRRITGAGDVTVSAEHPLSPYMETISPVR